MKHLARTLCKDELKDNDQVVIEEEASLINNYLNSIKLVKEEVDMNLNSTKAKKTMKELIAEALIENSNKCITQARSLNTTQTRKTKRDS
jgi:UDP-N-acetylglucosamine pyrophosphorylase